MFTSLLHYTYNTMCTYYNDSVQYCTCVTHWSYCVLHCSHCVRTASPPGAQFPAGTELPHVPAPPGQSGVPPGEGCYECNVNAEGIPLERPLTLRNRRDTRNETRKVPILVS